MRRRNLRLAGVVAAAMLGVAGWTSLAAARPDGTPPEHSHSTTHDISPTDLDDVRRATAEFHDVENAVASGRRDLDLCFPQMGSHYADPATFSDGVLDPEAPEALVYADDGNGRPRLVAVEWVSTTPGNVLDIPLHLNQKLNVYVLHAWVWHHNPNGTLADFNPRVGNCPATGSG